MCYYHLIIIIIIIIIIIHREGLSTAAREIVGCKLDFEGVHYVRWGQRGHNKSRRLFFFMRKEMTTINWGQNFFTPQNNISIYESRVC
jgi:hypothetical protein